MTAKIVYMVPNPGAFRGLYRTVAWAYVTNGTMSFQVSEAGYRALGYGAVYAALEGGLCRYEASGAY